MHIRLIWVIDLGYQKIITQLPNFENEIDKEVFTKTEYCKGFVTNSFITYRV